MKQFECPDSRFLTHVTYEDGELAVYLKRNKEVKKYVCVGVPQFIYNGFEKAKSKGAFFNNNIRGKFKHEYFREDPL